jgi:hypothetical protein
MGPDHNPIKAAVVIGLKDGVQSTSVKVETVNGRKPIAKYLLTGKRSERLTYQLKTNIIIKLERRLGRSNLIVVKRKKHEYATKK